LVVIVVPAIVVLLPASSVRTPEELAPDVVTDPPERLVVPPLLVSTPCWSTLRVPEPSVVTMTPDALSFEPAPLTMRPVDPSPSVVTVSFVSVVAPPFAV
jgi:hypothetical protein